MFCKTAFTWTFFTSEIKTSWFINIIAKFTFYENESDDDAEDYLVLRTRLDHKEYAALTFRCNCFGIGAEIPRGMD